MSAAPFPFPARREPRTGRFVNLPPPQLRRSFAMHWGTFRLSDDPLGEPPVCLARARSAAGIAPESFCVLKFGETVRV